MPKLLCPCGFVHDLSPIPDAGWQTIPDASYDDLLDAEIELRRLDRSHAAYSPDTHDKLTMIVAATSGLLYECPQCKRLMWKKPLTDEFVVYTIEPLTS